MSDVVRALGGPVSSRVLDFRRPIPPVPIECYDLPHPDVPRGLDGATVLHLSDLHVRRVAPASARTRALLEAVASVEVDVVALTGDLMDEPGHEAATLEMLALVCDAARARRGVFAVLGNHDRPVLARGLSSVAGLTALGVGSPNVVDLDFADATLRLIGLNWPEDILELAGPGLSPLNDRPASTLPLLLAHHPSALVPAAAARVPVLLAGHTHAGQVRLHARYAPHTSSDLPPNLATGMLRLGETLCCISRGVGDGVVEHLRLNCPRQIPLYTLRSGPMPPLPRGGSEQAITQVVAW